MLGDGTCKKCSDKEEFEDCLDCSFGKNGKMNDCTMCSDGKVLMMHEEGPRTCEFPPIKHCEIQDEYYPDYCKKCYDGYTWDGKNCIECDIPYCSKCYQVTVGYDTFLDCLECEDDLFLVLTY